jgi:putative component of toxin-antitoxin plasmid stabilization module
MKIQTIITLMLTLLTLSSHARLGEDIGECMARYGDPVSKDIQPGQPVGFLKNDIEIYAMFNNDGRCDAIHYRRVDTTGEAVELGEHTIAKLLQINMGDDIHASSDEGVLQWIKYDGPVFATYQTREYTLLICTQAGMDRSSKEDRTAQEKALDGF